MKPFHIMAKPHGPTCNLDFTCSYYIEKENLYAASGRDFRMRDEVLESYIRQYIGSHASETVHFSWQGGEALQFGRFLQQVFDVWVIQDVGRIFVQIFDVALESRYCVPQSLCVFQPDCGQALAVEHNGELYSCGHFVYPDNKLGNIMDRPLGSLVESPQQSRFGKAKSASLPSDCRRCDVRFACNGECPKHRFTQTASDELGLNYLCAGYKHFFRHIDPYMRFMANELNHNRAPARVMEWVCSRRGAAGSAAVTQPAYANHFQS